ncbi:MAG: phosphoadenosine phosphosulfate reductase family protein [Saprospiraceae bacterium]|nr:phosphoadenosine phosphosulfate reductase family protein [Saprospiraceae bacterium]
MPLDPIKAQHKVWVSGLMVYQTEFRSHLRVFERQGDIIKFHPLIDIDEGEVLYQFSLNNLPKHPLEDMGSGSIGCTHCTKKGEGRDGRFQGQSRTECGLHPKRTVDGLRVTVDG